ncbi:MAG TPA: polysaccharide deacetylase family protein, partial [candidate division WOR-3 bacterium]|nr:polysaccharide deacetylase family protein [candidate division WOR-3 bacterium]
VSTAPLPLAGHTVVLSVDDGYHSVFTNIYPLLKRHRMTMTLGVICDYLRGGSPSYGSGAGFVRRSEVREMVDSCGIEIASHSLSHPFLTRLDSAAAWREIHDSKVILESLFGEEVLTFVYPYGDLNARTVRMVQAAGYRMGRAVREGRFDLETDPWRVPTVELRLETSLETIKRQVLARPVTILLLHQVVRNPRVFTEWPLDDFAELLEWLDSGGARVTTLRRLHREWRQERLGPVLAEIAAAFPDDRKRLSFQDVNINATQAPHAR